MSGEPAFPAGAAQMQAYPGLTKRELFAAMAMQAILGNSQLTGAQISGLKNGGDWIQNTSEAATQFADGLIAELSKEAK